MAELLFLISVSGSSGSNGGSGTCGRDSGSSDGSGVEWGGVDIRAAARADGWI